jgi:hypothetical protein
MTTHTLGRRILLLGPPFVLMLLLLTHPVNPRAQLSAGPWPWADWWITLHILQLALFGLMGYAVTLLLPPQGGHAATISRIAMGIFVIFYNAGDAIAGITTGILVRNARSLPPDQQAVTLQAVQMLFVDPTKNLVFVIGSYAWVIGLLATAVALYRASKPLPAVALLLPSAVMLGFLDHQPPIGPLAFGFFLLAAAWLEFAPQQSAAHGRTSQPSPIQPGPDSFKK